MEELRRTEKMRRAAESLVEEAIAESQVGDIGLGMLSLEGGGAFVL